MSSELTGRDRQERGQDTAASTVFPLARHANSQPLASSRPLARQRRERQEEESGEVEDGGRESTRTETGRH